MTNTKDTSMAEFEAWLRTVCFQSPTPEAYDLAQNAWQAARAGSIDSQLDNNTIKKMVFLSESKKSMRPVGIVLIDDDTNQRCTIDMGRVTWTDQPAEPIIDGYPLWSGLPPPIETADLINRLQTSIGDAESYEFKPVSVANIRAAVAMLSQPLIAEAARDDAAVDQFALAMKAKLTASRLKGRGGWDDPTQCTIEYLSELLRSHIAKGDPVDVGNFAMMIHQRGGAIAAVKRDDAAVDAVRLHHLFSMLPLSYFCCAYDIPIPNAQIRDFSVWAKSVIDAHISASTKGAR